MYVITIILFLYIYKKKLESGISKSKKKKKKGSLECVFDLGSSFLFLQHNIRQYCTFIQDSVVFSVAINQQQTK